MTNLFQPPVVAEPYVWLAGSVSKRIGVHKVEGWCVDTHAGVLFIKNDADCMLLLPLLEIVAHDFFSSLEVAKKLVPVYVDSISSFPKEGLIRYALTHSVSDYWPDKALGWLEEDISIVSELMVALERLAENKLMSQRIRHNAKRLMNSSA